MNEGESDNGGGVHHIGPCSPFLFLPFLTKSLYKVVSGKADHMLIIMQGRAGPRVRQVRYLNAKGKETPICRCPLCIYMTLRVSSSLNFAGKVPQVYRPSPSPDVENSCSVYLSTK